MSFQFDPQQEARLNKLRASHPRSRLVENPVEEQSRTCVFANQKETHTSQLLLSTKLFRRERYAVIVIFQFPILLCDATLAMPIYAQNVIGHFILKDRSTIENYSERVRPGLFYRLSVSIQMDML